MKVINRQKLRDIIQNHFDLHEIEVLCFDLGVHHQDIPGDTLNKKATELVRHFAKQDRLDDLLEACKRARPGLDWGSIYEIPNEPEAKGFIEYRQLGKEKVGLISTTIALLLIFFVIAILRSYWVNSSPCADLSIGDMDFEKKVLEIGETTKVSVSVDNPQGRSVVFNWSAVNGIAEAGLNSNQQESRYIPPRTVGADTISVRVESAGCETIQRSGQIRIVHALTSFPTPTVTVNTSTLSPTSTRPATRTPPPDPDLPSSPTSTSPMCLQSIGPRWGDTLWNLYKDELVCAFTTEKRIKGAFQLFEDGLVIWRDRTDGYAEQIYVLYYDGTFEVFPVTAPQGFYESPLVKGAIGHLWSTNQRVKAKLNEPIGPEDNATHFAVQDFMGGVILYFLENEARNYVLLNDNLIWNDHQD